MTKVRQRRRHNAAASVQAVYRGQRDRSTASERRTRYNSAIKLQAAQRGRVVRRRAGAWREAAQLTALSTSAPPRNGHTKLRVRVDAGILHIGARVRFLGSGGDGSAPW